MRSTLFITLTLCAVSGPALADPQALSAFVPVQTQDALVIRTGVLELQGYGLYTRDDHNSRGRDLLTLSPTLKIGAMKGMQIDLALPYAVGTQSIASQGSTGLDMIYNFNDPTPTFPALAVQVGYQTPYGAGHHTDVWFVRGLATQWLGTNDQAPRLHLNLNYAHANTPSSTSRKDVVELGVGYSMLLTPKTALVLDVVHGAKNTKGQNETIVDAGLRWEITDDWILSGSVGAGIGQQSPPFRVLFAIQKDFSLF
jgi:hypothetical protein